MTPTNRISAEADRTGVRVDDPALKSTLEIAYLRPLLEALPPEWRTAIDLGAGAGDASAELLARGLRVLGVEPNPSLAAPLRRRFDGESRRRQFQLEGCSAVDEEGALAAMLDSHGFREIGVARVALDGRQWPALNALIGRRAESPAIVTFEVGTHSSDIALGCLAFLWERGYGTFDVFIKRGADPVAAERFTGSDLPAVWQRAAGTQSTAGFIAYHGIRSADVGRLNPRRFVSDFQVLKSQHLLRSALKEEARVTYEDGLADIGGLTASRVRSEMRFDILNGGWAAFLSGRIGRHLGARASWGPRHERRRSALAASRFGRTLVERLQEPRTGAGGAVPPAVAAGLSVPMTGALYNLMRIHEQTDGRLPRRVVEAAGGWGLGAYAYTSVIHDAAYAIVDHPEALAIQHYFLTLSSPMTEVRLATPDATPNPGSILLVPASSVRRSPNSLECELLHSSHSREELFPSIRSAIRRCRSFGASNTYFAGDWAFEADAIAGPPRALAA